MAATREDIAGWRQNMFGLESSTEHGQANLWGIREALVDLATDAAQSFGQLASGVREHWGSATSPMIRAHLVWLVRHGRLVWTGAGFVRAPEIDEDSEDDE